MEKVEQFTLELQKLLEKYDAEIGTELADRGIILCFENNKQVYLFDEIYIDKDNATKIKAW